ncbi:hypothetical protein [Rhodococcus koreensis]|jgi:hypothetical protein|uniref:Uncharacterized protein n=1 Tax=Rhodococcus koreensis TaxID=99653 RepID=A0A1H4VKN9_9NOCA|nr:hypothetical protein [Rhodococcus koreensis]QSE81179.1 hypothetical protein JWS14_19535 [Rhodococcus koreensis]SEC81400.1 hypothetical protein SAMN04490239_5563 [Rhodococcus koreensis]
MNNVTRGSSEIHVLYQKQYSSHERASIPRRVRCQASRLEPRGTVEPRQSRLPVSIAELSDGIIAKPHEASNAPEGDAIEIAELLRAHHNHTDSLDSAEQERTTHA